MMVRTAMFALLCVVLVSGHALANDGFGVGIIAGEPTGVSGEMWLTKSTAIDAAAAWSFSGADDSFLIQSDYLFYNMGLFDSVRTGTLALYFGMGGRIKFASDTQAGIRVPVGVDYLFETAPVDIFLELVPVLDLVKETEFDFNAAIGVRYFFGRTTTAASEGIVR
jgi:hypothetical protein